jgi:hypothetical protein
VWPFRKGAPEGFEVLEKRIDSLERDNAERQLRVLDAVEKTLHRLRQRIDKRVVEDTATDATPPMNPAGIAPSPLNDPARARLWAARKARGL